MKLLSVNAARALWFIHLSDLNPRGRSVDRHAIPLIGKRYSFVKIPTSLEIIEAQKQNQPVLFNNGSFKAPSEKEIEVTLTVYRDALFADTRSSTTDSEAFLVDLLEWTTAELGLVDYKTVAVRKLYVSELYIHMDKSLNMINPKLSQFAKTLQQATKTPFKNISFELASLGFWIDPAIKHVHVPFRIERQADAPFSEERYYSIAPLETEEHLKMLESLEEFMSD